MLVGKKAPLFNSPAVINGNEIVKNFTLEQFIGKKYVFMFFYPADFTFVCPTELIAFQERIEDFKKLDVEVVAVSADSEFSHWKWLQTPLNEGGIKGVKYPMVADFSKTICENYGVLAGEYDIDEEGNSIFNGAPVPFRANFLIDRSGTVRHMLVNDLSLGRDVDEALRLIKALQFVEEYGEVCPANWKEGETGLKATQEGIADYLGGKEEA
jgi:peroxiredoxin 2/4